MGASCTASEQGIRRALSRIADRFSAQFGSDYGFIIAPQSDRRWTVAATVSVPWKAAALAEYQAALDAIRARIPLID